MNDRWKKYLPYTAVLPALFVGVLAVHTLLTVEQPEIPKQIIEKILPDTVQAAQAEPDEVTKETEQQVQGSYELENGSYEGSAMGYRGEVKVAVDIADKSITGIEVLAETDDEPFFTRATGVIDEIIANQSVEVDVVSGATYSSNGIIGAVNNALTGEESEGQAHVDPQPVEAAAEEVMLDENAKYKDGTYYGTGTGFRGEVTVKVVIAGGVIASIDVEKSSDDEAYFGKARGLLQTILAQQTTNVDTISGATYSSKGLINAVRNALAQAAVTELPTEEQPTTEIETETEQPADEEKPTDTAEEGTIPYKNGTYKGTGYGFAGKITVSVKIKSKTIKTIQVVKNEADNEPYFTNAKKVLDRIVKAQSTEVDVVSGATYSSNGLIEAVENALAEAKRATEGTDKETPVDTEIPADTESTEVTPPEEDVEEELLAYTNGDYTVTVPCVPDADEMFEAYDLSMTVTIKNDKVTALEKVAGSGDNYTTFNDVYINWAVDGRTIRDKEYAGLKKQLCNYRIEDLFTAVQEESTEALKYDAISGATCTSKAIAEGVAEVKKQAAK